ncbi:class I SAM-dependent methyltransferase [Kitasatospora azatica]|uniref:class I SAM-dependent methyltransferase n=1 Tax=Kitasatospora azatica TaxID=58347 RepID=UPI00056C9FAF|nr:class I SAM-dependent methyltransferase [Kitasatospora azatica]
MTNSEVEEFWEGHYQQRDRIWSGRANAVLVDVAGPLTPGSALDLGCGEGGDAVWLAGRGWRVTAVDVSGTALRRAATGAAEAGVQERIDFQQLDLATAFPAGRFDLVSAQFLQSPVELPRERVLSRAAQAVAPGGLLLVVEHGAFPPWSRHAHAHAHTHFPTPQETFDALDLPQGLWRTERLASAERQATGPDGQQAVLTDNVIALRRVT